MSLILDALARAEQERQQEKQPESKFIAPPKPEKKSFKRMSAWVGGALFVNALVLGYIFWPHKTSHQENTESVISDTTQVAVAERNDTSSLSNNPSLVAHAESAPIRPLAREVIEDTKEVANRPLFDESKTNERSAESMESAMAESDDEHVMIPLEKFIGSQDEQNSASNQMASASQNATEVTVLQDAAAGTRDALGQYEVNVHVFDTNPAKRFVLINMAKYREGDQVAGSGPIIKEITRQGVVVNHNGRQVLLPPK